ncbi:SusC/RagA family TonB-linked outer membrane protein [Mucilaginibacter psychrotolerans]|uniref:TonB-dependent receptor n=1 Tax=Mucilaginibacter psychrotolerans TaxID=1524096 RepID=A0A4Y8SEA5_9SPHI|nr:TonB-dependent receptor [Mucilaginibacter psychrotolerans]TFF36940.1 TonB-dependent receptor [Mucilaginibacter psychrotolerans]
MEIFIHAKSSRITLFFSLFALLNLSSFIASAQTPTTPIINSKLTGRVTDAVTTEPLPGAVVTIKGTTHAVAADADGRFSFVTGQKFPYTLIVTFTGFDKQELVVDGSPVEIKLKASLNQLNDVVVVGYGTQTRKSLIGSVSKISAQETKNTPVASFDAQLQGKAAGVQVNTLSGMPGEGVRIVVRGTASINASNDPLFVIDGIIANNNSLATIDLGGKKTSPLADINPADIESIEVLKDASAIAIYGSRASNGVVLVTTKRGEYGSDKPRFNLNTYNGFQWADKSRLWKLTTGPEHAMLVNEQWINSGIDNPALNQNFANRPFRPASEVINGVAGRGLPEEQQTYDKLSEEFRTAKVQNYDFNVTGGSAKIRYYIGTGYTDQQSILIPADFKRASVKLNFDIKLSKYLTFGSSNGVYHSIRQQVRDGAGQAAGHLLAALHSPTYLPIYNPDGTLARGSLYENVENLINTDITDISTNSTRYVGNQFLEVKLLTGLKFKTSVGLDYDLYKEGEYFNDQTITGGVTYPGGYKNSVITNYTIFQNEQTLSYTKDLGGHQSLNVLIGNSIQTTTLDATGATGYGFPNNSYKEISSAAVRTSSENKSKSTIASFFGRINYNISEKYYFEGSIRADGSSKFGANNRWGYFPAVGAAWRIKEESFLKDNKTISDLKFRASVGQAGNQNGLNDYAAQGLWSGAAQYPDNLTSGSKAGTAPAQLANPDLKWETTTTYNAGIDLGLFNNRVSIDLTAYYKYTKNALLNLPVPTSTGYSSTLANAGEISNKGIEIGINTTNIKVDKFEWTTNFNFSRNINKAEKLASPITFEAREYLRDVQGAPLLSFWLYKQLYVDPQTGNAVFQHADGTTGTTVTSADRMLLGTLYPKFYGGITNTFTYRDFDLSAFFSFQYGNSVFNFNKYILEGGGTRDASRSILASQLNRWTTPGQITNTPRVTSVGNNYNIEQNSRYLEDGSFIRLKNLVVGYTLPKALTNKFNIQRLRVYVQGTNLLLFTHYTGPDPESSGSGVANLQGIDTATPPQPVGVQFGVNLTF